MLGKRGVFAVVILFAAAVFFAGGARARLDRLTESFRSDFREMLYLPRGDSLRIIAAGFDSPLADALYIKGLVFYSQALDIPDARRESARAYSHALFDVITDLSPRFINAYRTGATLLASANSLAANLDSVRLLDKGIGYWDDLEKAEEKVAADPRWLFHVMQAMTYNINLQNRLMREGDMAGAAEARSRAADEFRLAAMSPQAPPFVMEAAVGFQRSRSGAGNVEEGALAVQRIWTELHDRAPAKGESEVAEDLARRLRENGDFIQAIQDTRSAEAAFSQAGRAFTAARRRAPRSMEELAEAGILRGLPSSLPLDDGAERDMLLPLPDGSFKSRRLAALETERQLRVLTDSLAFYSRANGRKFPPDLPALVASGFLDVLPVPPLAAAGQRFEYSPENGRVIDVMPLGPGF